MAIFNFERLEFGYEPYPVGVAREFVEPEYYRHLIDNFPSDEIFGWFGDTGSNKKALSELYRADEYHRFVRRTPVYRELYHYIKSPVFIREVLSGFERNFIHLSLLNAKVTSSTLPLRGPAYHLLERAQRRLRRNKGLRARFEFSALSADGGNIRPHTDAPSKIITMVVSILKPGEWNPAWGGGTEMLRPKDIRRNYNFHNSYLNFEECETLRTIEYVPNQAILFLKTFNSLHCVRPILNKGGTSDRRTLTINIETA